MSEKKSSDVLVVNGVEYVRKSAADKLPKVNRKKYIVRTYSAGVFFGEIVKRDGKETVMRNARRLWKWDGANSLSQLAMEGTRKPENCMFPCAVTEVILTETIEILPCTDVAIESIEGVAVWKE